MHISGARFSDKTPLAITLSLVVLLAIVGALYWWHLNRTSSIADHITIYYPQLDGTTEAARSVLLGAAHDRRSVAFYAVLSNYLQFERWVRDHISQPDDATKARWTDQILALQKSEEQATAELAEAGAPDLSIRSVILLNDMVDWKHMHDHVVAKRAART